MQMGTESKEGWSIYSNNIAEGPKIIGKPKSKAVVPIKILIARWTPITPPEQWEHDPARLRRFMNDFNLTALTVSKLVGVKAGERATQHWLSPPTRKTAHKMPYATWFTLVHRAIAQRLENR